MPKKSEKFEKYIDFENTKIKKTEIVLKLKKEGIKYGSTKKGANCLAIFAVEKYREEKNKNFKRPAINIKNCVANEIQTHCRWALKKGLGKIPFVKKRANPINIHENDKPPFWH